jgi:hypothetical protein
MTYNLVILSKYEDKNVIYPAESSILCKTHYEEKEKSFQDYKITKINSSKPNIWCETCNPVN